MTSSRSRPKVACSAIVLGLLPLGLGVAMYVINPDYIADAVHTTRSATSCCGARSCSLLVGFFWMKKIIEIEI